MTKFPKQPTLLLNAKGEPPLLGGIVEECNALGWRVINIEYIDDYLISQQTPIGAILVNVPRRAGLDQIRERNIPIVCTSAASSNDFSEDGRVFPDRFGAGRLAANAFIERGFKHVAFVSFGSGTHSDPLSIGLREVAERNGVTPHLCELATADGKDTYSKHKQTIHALMEWVQDLPKPVGILAYNYRMGVRITAACEMAGLSVPEQVAIACQGNSDLQLQTAPVPLSGIDMNAPEQGRQAVRLMKRMVDGEAPPEDPIYVPVKAFVERRSTDIFAISDPRVAKAVRFMWDHLSWPLKVEDVAEEVGTSQNTLKRAFKRSLNRGINAELRRKRLETCKELLRSTGKTLAEIAKAVGFASSRHLHRSFKAAYDMTPNEYRKSCMGE